MVSSYWIMCDNKNEYGSTQKFTDFQCFPFQNPKGFTIDLLDFLGSQAQYLHSLLMLQQSGKNSPGSTQTSRLNHVEMSLEALRNVIRNNPGMFYV